MSEVLYRKYRPLSFDEVVGQEHVIKTIRNSIKNGKVAHAYLFSGPRGIGKTTIARILAKTVNCKDQKDGNPCNKCEICLSINQNSFLDMVEIDAATHTQVDKMRDIIEKINFAPSVGKYKVYIIDEVHMLSKGAFNALLKTLEEPPKHVIFILATTEIHKIPATIISRCQKFDFRRMKVSEITKCLSEIAKKEGVEVENGVLDFIAMNSNGGLRDSESLFGQILSIEEGNKITLEEVQKILSVADISIAVKIINLILEKKYSEAIGHISKITDDGYDLEQFAGSVVEYARRLMLIKISPEMEKHFSSEMTEEQISELKEISQKSSISHLVKIIRVFIKSKEEVKSAIIPQLPLELAVAQINIENEESLTEDKKNDYNNKIAQPIKKITEKVSQQVKQSGDFVKKSIGLEKKEKKIEQKIEAEGSVENIREEKEKTKTINESNISLEAIRDEWCEILEEVKPHNHSLTAFLKTCQPIDVKGGEVLVSVKYSFHKDKLQRVENRVIVEDVIEEILKEKILLKFITQDEAEKMGYKIEEMNFTKKESKKEAGDDLVNSALDMFGGEVV
ncbi:DNA polymerase III subunit gamma/tau [Candidatus Parcubacteria bacterium]|nr:DNA polymerase III subunit gamma/tau [Candidatus Parcubacteria bacterium]